MTKYRQRYVPGGTYFFTVQLRDTEQDLLVREIDLLRQVTGLCLRRWPCKIEAAVILPNKLHMIWALPQGDAAYCLRWRFIKSTFARHVPEPQSGDRPCIRTLDRHHIWKRRFWEHAIRDKADYDRHLHLMTSAPVDAGLVGRASDWPYASWAKGGNSARSVQPQVADARAVKVTAGPALAARMPALKTTAPVPSNRSPSVAANATGISRYLVRESLQ